MASSPERESENVACCGVNGETFCSITKQVICNGLSSIRESIAEKVASPHLWNDVLAMWCVIASLLDPLFCYILVVDQHKNCIRFDKKLRLTVVVLRSLIDLGYILLVVFQFRVRDAASPDKINGGFCSIARKYLLSSFPADSLAVLPLPQVVVFVLFRATKGSHFTFAIRTLKFVLVFQLLPRVFRVYSFLKKIRWSFGISSNSAGPKAIFNLFLYILASHGFGAFWYLFSIERKATCLQVRCHSHPYCPQLYNNSSVERLCTDGCSGKASSSDIAAFDFGIFGDAFNSGIVYSTDFVWKFSYCSWWGLQNLSSLGQGLKTSGDIREIYFAVSLTVSGLVLFALLIGNLQTILQAEAERQEVMRLKKRRKEMELWLTDQKLPPAITKQIKQYEQNKWQKTRGIEIAEILHNLPNNLRKQITRHLCYDAIRSVPMFRCADDKFFDAMCVFLKPILHHARSFIVSEGQPLEEVILITKGMLRVYSNSNGGGETLEKGNYFGEDLIEQTLEHLHLSTVLMSTKTLYTRTEVEAFVLSAEDLNNVINKYWWQFSRALRKDPAYIERRKDPDYKERWETQAALYVQTTWRRIIKKRKKEEQLQSSSTIGSGQSQRTFLPLDSSIV